MGLGRASWNGREGLPPPFRRPLCPSCRAGFAPIPTEYSASRASGPDLWKPVSSSTMTSTSRAAPVSSLTRASTSRAAGEIVDQGQRRPRAGHCRRLWERLWERRRELGANTYRVLVHPTSTERTPTPPDTSRNRPAGAPLRPPVIDGIEERSFLASMRFHPIGGGPKTTKTDKNHSSRQESHPLLDRPAIERPCRTRISCHHLVWAAH